jgi:hypothetical protein
VTHTIAHAQFEENLVSLLRFVETQGFRVVNYSRYGCFPHPRYVRHHPSADSRHAHRQPIFSPLHLIPSNSVPYLCQGDFLQDFYVLDDIILVLAKNDISHNSNAPAPQSDP